MTLLNLADRCERAVGPDRGLDAAIWYAYVEKPQPGDKRDKDMIGRWPAYTASIDAAMTLIGDDCWKVEDHPLAGPCAVVGEQEGYAATPALALCAASLRSRQEKQDG